MFTVCLKCCRLGAKWKASGLIPLRMVYKRSYFAPEREEGSCTPSRGRKVTPWCEK